MDYCHPVMYIDVHTHQSHSGPDVIAIRNIRVGWQQPGSDGSGPVCYGIHPWDSDQENILNLLNKVNLINKLCAIGECGLDNKIKANPEIQKEVFLPHIHLSETLHIPLIIHCVGAYNEIIKLNKTLSPSQPWIVHGFQGHPQLALQLVGSGIFLSFGAAILRHNSKSADALRAMPAGSFFLETDDSQHKIQEVYQQAAKLRHESEDYLINLIYNQFKALFEVKYGMD